MPKIGAHVSVAGGLKNGVINAKAIGAECLQIFGASPRQWAAKQPSAKNVAEYKEALEEAKLGPVFLHAAYLVNLANPNEEMREKSIGSLVAHLKIAEAIGAEGLIFHVGSAKEASPEEAVGHIIKGVKEVLKKVPGKTKLILENDAGGGAKVGSLAEIGEIIRGVKSKRVGVCLDTAHSLESGLIEKYTPVAVKNLFDEFEKKIGLKHLTVLHVNDSKTPAGSHRDRHENIGEGYVGRAGFKALGEERRIKNLPWILEVPGFDGNGPDKRNIDILRKITSTK